MIPMMMPNSIEYVRHAINVITNGIISMPVEITKITTQNRKKERKKKMKKKKKKQNDETIDGFTISKAFNELTF